jgi:hypothetical protein
MRKAPFVALVITMMVVSVSRATADGLQPCESWVAGFVKDLSDDSQGSSSGQVMLTYLDLPGLSTGWGFQIVRSKDQFLLRTIQFRRAIEASIVELQPGVFGPNPVQPDPFVRTASISRSLVERLSAVAIAEIGQADRANARMGLDGEGYYFYAKDQCAWAWSPDPGTKSQRLTDIFQDLKAQPLLPTRLVRLFWEKRVIARLNHYGGSVAMPLYHYLIIVAFGIGIVVVGALPLVIAWIVTLIPKRLQRKRRFVVVSGALSYGFTCFVGLILLPFILIGWQVAAQLDVDGHSDLAVTLDFIAKHSMFALLGVAFVFAVIVPIYLRRRWSATFANPIASGEGA